MGRSSLPRELLGAATRSRREPDPAESDEGTPRRLPPGKLLASEIAEYPAYPVAPGKLRRDQLDPERMSPSRALAQADRLGPIDRRSMPGADLLVDEGGALASAFGFVGESRGGRPLPPGLLARLTAELAVDLSRVRIHDDERAARAAAALGARAFTIGDDIYFARGAYDPASERGVELIAHEVAHVAQRRRGEGATRPLSRSDDPHERQADAFAHAFTCRGGDPDPAELVNRTRRDGSRIALPFLGELEDHFGIPLDFVEAYTGDAARLACELMAAGAFAVQNVVAFADPSPQREVLLHELAHVVQMGGRAARAPEAFLAGSLRVGGRNDSAEHDAHRAVRSGVVGHASDATVVRRADPAEGKTQPWSIEEAVERFGVFAQKVDKRKPRTKHAFGKPGTKTVRYLNTSTKPFRLSEYQASVKTNSKYKALTDADLEKDLKEVHARRKDQGLVKVGSASAKRWAWIDPAENPSDPVDYLLEEVYKHKSNNEKYEGYCKALACLKKLQKKPTLDLPDKAVCTLSTSEEAQLYTDEELSECRKAIREALIAEPNYKLKNDQWKTFFDDVVAAKDKFPQKLVGDAFEQIAARDLAEKGKQATAKQIVFEHDDLPNDVNHRADGVLIEGSQLKIMEFKTGPASPGKAADDGEGGKLISQAGAYATIIKLKIPAVDVPNTKRKGPFTQCVYVFPTKEMAKRWGPELQKAFEAKEAAGALVVYPPAGKGIATLTFNPSFEVPLESEDAITHRIANPAIVHPGVSFRKVDLTMKGAGSPEIASGEVLFDLDLQGGVKAENVRKPITPAPGGGAVENDKFAGLKSTFDKIFKGRVEPSAKLTDTGVEATLKVKAGPSGIPKLDLKEATITVGYAASGQLTVTGSIDLSHQNGKLHGNVTVGWDGAGWTFKGVATLDEGMIEGLGQVTGTVEYEQGNWKFGIPQASYSRKLGAVTLTGTAHGLSYDVKQGHFSGLVDLTADLGMFGKASATAELEKNKLKKAELSYDSPELKYPAKGDKPTFKGTVGGTLVYENEKFRGDIRGTANLDVPALSKIAGEGGLGLAVAAKVNADGQYSGSIKTTSPLKFGKHFEIPKIGCEIKEDGSVEGEFAIKIVNFKYLDNAQIECAITKDGFTVKKADISVAFGKANQDKFWGTLTAKYEEGKGLAIRGDLSAKIKEGMVAKGVLEYTTEKNEVSVELSIDEIQLLDLKKKQNLFKFSKQFPLASFYNVIGIYLDIGFDLDFDFNFTLGLKPKLKLEGLSLDTWEYTKIAAELELLGALIAKLTATPKVGLGLFAIHPSLLRGGGGIQVPITGEAKISPKGTLSVGYTPSGGVEGDATIGMVMTFGIKGSVNPYAEAVLLDGAWEKSWKGEPLTEFEILPPKELFNFTVDLAGDTSKKKEPELPSSPEAPKGNSAAKQLPQDEPAKGQAGSASADKSATPPTSGPSGEKPSDDVFKMGSLASALEGLPGYKAISGFMEKAGKVWEQIKGFFGRVAKAFKSFFQAMADAIEEIIEGFASEGLRYLPKLIKKIVGASVYEVIEPIVNAVAGTAEEILELFETDPPKGAADFFPWALKLAKKVFGIAVNGISSLVSAIRTLMSRLADAAVKLVTHMVNQGMVGVQRHCYYIWKPVGRNYYFLAATQYKIHVFGFDSEFKQSGALTNPKSAVAMALFEVLETMGVPPTNTAYDEDARASYRDRWV
jgi:hypothetical protein